MTEEDDPFAGGIELEFDEMEARRQAAAAVAPKPAPKIEEMVTAVGHSPGGHVHSSRPPKADAGGPPQPGPGPSEGAGAVSVPHQSGQSGPSGKIEIKTYTAPPPPLWRSIGIVVGFLILGGGFLAFWYRAELFPPNPIKVVAHITEGEDNELIFKGETYQATFKFDEEVEGFVDQVLPTHFPKMPFITHELVVVNGDYANPAMVVVKAVEDHQAVVDLKVDNPEGELSMLYVIPADPQALTDLLRVKKGQYVVFLGDTIDGMLSDSTGQVKVQSSGAGKIFRLREILFDQEPP